jgi:hypothetical protein
MRQASVTGNPRVRTPQREANVPGLASADGQDPERQVGVVLPVGCGKSGLITMLLVATRSRRTVVVARGKSGPTACCYRLQAK